MWMDEGNKVKQTMKMEVRGTRAKGRPRMRWMDNIRHDISKDYTVQVRILLERCPRQKMDGVVQNPDLASQLDKGEDDSEVCMRFFSEVESPS